MSKDRLGAQTMTVEEAADLVSHVVAQRIRWGKHYDGQEYKADRLLDALVVLAQSENLETSRLREELTLANRRLAAANAREAKAAKRDGGE